MDKALQNLSAIFSFATPALPIRIVKRHRMLAWLLTGIGAASVLLLLVALAAAGRASRAFEDVNLSGSLRFRSLWVYGVTQNRTFPQPQDSRWPAQVAEMRGIRVRLHHFYPAAVDETDPAWKAFSGELARTGQVDWQTADTLRTAANTLTEQIEKQAAAQSEAASVLLRLGLGGLLCALGASGVMLAGLQAAEQDASRTTRRLQDSQELFLGSINALQEGYLVQGRDGRLLFCNAAAERLLGRSASELIGQEVLRPEWRCLRENGDEFPRGQHSGIRVLQTALPQEDAVFGIERPGEPVVWLSLQAAPVFHAEETIPCAAVLTLTDITAEKQGREELQKERDFQAAMLESLQSGVVACDADGILRLFNRAAREFHGLPEEPLPADRWAQHFDLYRTDGVTPLPMEEIPLARAFSGELVRDAEMVIAPEGCPHRIVLASGQAIYGGDGQKLGAVVAMQDITARRRVELELSRLAAIVESSEEAILAMTLDGTLISWNAGAERLYGYAEGEVIGRHASLLVSLGEFSMVEAIIARVKSGKLIAPMEALRRCRDGREIAVELTYSPIHSTDGEVVGLSCIARDITARREAEAALRESEARLRYLSDAAFEGIAVSQNGIILDANPAFVSLFGYESCQEVVGLPGEQLAVPEAREIVRQKVASGDENAYEILCLRRDGSTFPAEVRGRTALWNGLPARVTAVRDVTERRHIEAALQESRQFAQSLTEHSASLVFVLDLEVRRLIYANRTIPEALGYSADDIRDAGPRLMPSLVHSDDLLRFRTHVEELQTLADGAVSEIEYRVRHADGGWRWMWSRDVIFKRRPDGTPWQMLSNTQDITGRKSLEEALRRSEEAMRAVLSSAPVILYAAALDGTITLSEGAGLAALGLKPGEAGGWSVSEFSSNDPGAADGMRRAFAGETVSYDTRYGGFCLHVALRPQHGPDGAVRGIIGVCFDITARAQSEERFRVLFDHSSEAHFFVGPQGIIDCNQAALQLLRCPGKAELLALHPRHLSPEHQPDGRLSSEKGVEMDAAALAHGSHRFEWTHTRFDRTEFPTEVILTPVTLGGQQVMLAVWHDLTEQKQAEQQIRDYTVILEFQNGQLEETNKELEALATTDGLTGLKNHRTFQAKLAEEYARASRYGQPLSLLLLDVDHFKQYNDRFGHPAGDAVLRRVAAILERSARDTDIAARYGGEEFAVILPLTDEAGALSLAERVRAAVAGEDWAKRAITVSVGVSTLSLDTSAPASMVALADEALYQSKEGGRNRVTHGNPSAPPLGGPPQAPRPKRSVSAS